VQPAATTPAGGLANDQVLAELSRLREAEEARQVSGEQTKKRVIVGLLLGILALMLLWSTGRMDPWLAGVGLNKNECFKNGFGATFCGDDAKAYQQQVDQITGASAATDYFSGDDATAAHANISVAIPAIEAFYSDNGSYAGMTLAALLALQPSMVNTTLGSVAAETYCVQSTVGTQTYSNHGPGNEILPGGC
jgi:hypothetical protein